MNRQTHKIFSLLFLLAVTVHAQSTDSLTIDEAIKLAIQNNPLVEQAAQSVKAASSRVEQSRSGYYPTTEAEISYTRLGPVSELAFGDLGLFQLFSPNNYDGHVSLKETVYDFGKTSASVDVSESSISFLSTNIDLIKTNISYQTIQAFYAMLYLRKNIDVQDEQIATLEAHQADTRKRILAGTATDFDTLTTRVRITSSENKKYDLENDLRKREATFRRLLGLPASADIRIRGDFNASVISVNTDSLLSLASNQRLELKQTKDEERISDLKQKVVSLSDKPVLKVDMEYGLKNGYFPDLDVLRGNWILGLNAKIPIFNGFLTNYQEQELEATKLATLAKTQDIERAVSSEVLQAISDVQTNAKKIDNSLLQLEQAKHALDLANLRYADGVATNLDVLDAETILSMAEFSRLDAMYNFVLSRYALEKAVGTDLSR